MTQRCRAVVAGPSAGTFAEDLRRDGRFLVPKTSATLHGVVADVPYWKPDVVILHVEGEEPDAVVLVEEIVREAPYVTVVVIGTGSDVQAATDLMEAGADGYLSSPVRPDYLPAYVHDLHSRVSNRKAHWVRRHLELVNPRRPHLAVVFSPKGGVGKTTVAANLAVSLRRLTNQPVVLMDMDVEAGDTATLLDLQPRRTMADYARALAAGEQVDLVPYLTIHASGLKVLPVPTSPEQAEAIQPEHVHRALDAARQVADFVVADTAPSFNDQVLALLDRADTIFLLVTPDVAALRNVRTALEVMEGLNYPSSRIQPVVNRFSRDHGLSLAQVEEALGRPVLLPIPNDSGVVTAATNAGRPFVLEAPESAVARAVAELARYVVRQGAGNREGEPVARTGPLGFLRRLFRR